MPGTDAAPPDWPPPSAFELPPDGYRAVVGESFHQDALAATAPLARPGEEGRPMFRAVLLAEPDNPYDANAIAIHSAAGKVGHLSRGEALDYAPVMAALADHGYASGSCEAFLNGGPAEGKSFGVVLRLAPPGDCVLEIRAAAR
ncbi:MAG: hypothetical protein JWQ20_1068 [Conexibacter sp.]|nr:hypothetical protein [Conexibacter sp.]